MRSLARVVAVGHAVSGNRFHGLPKRCRSRGSFFKNAWAASRAGGPGAFSHLPDAVSFPIYIDQTGLGHFWRWKQGAAATDPEDEHGHCPGYALFHEGSALAAMAADSQSLAWIAGWTWSAVCCAFGLGTVGAGVGSLASGQPDSIKAANASGTTKKLRFIFGFSRRRSSAAPNHRRSSSGWRGPKPILKPGCKSVKACLASIETSWML